MNSFLFPFLDFLHSHKSHDSDNWKHSSIEKLFLYRINLNGILPRIQISRVQENCDLWKPHDLPVFVTVFDIQDLRKLPTPRIFILIFLQVKSINIRFKYKIYIFWINTYIFVLSAVSKVLFWFQVNSEFLIYLITLSKSTFICT